MAQYCPRCKWYSADGLANCSTCGAPFEDAEAELDDELEAEERPLLERVGWTLALAAGVIVGGMALYRRFATPENVGAAGAAVDQTVEAIKNAATNLYTLLVGQSGEYKDFVAIAVLGSAFVWFVLWLLARLGRR